MEKRRMLNKEPTGEPTEAEYEQLIEEYLSQRGKYRLLPF